MPDKTFRHNVPAAVTVLIGALTPVPTATASGPVTWHADPAPPPMQVKEATARRAAAPSGQTCAQSMVAHPPSGRTHRVEVKLGNGDDVLSVCVNGKLRGESGYDEYRTIDLGRLRTSDVIGLAVYNQYNDYSWGFDVIVDGVEAYHNWSGTVNDTKNTCCAATGIVFRKTFSVRHIPRPPPPDASGLSSEWCGSPAAASRGVSRTKRVPRIKFVYAYPSDAKNQFRRYAQLMESDAQAISDKMPDAISRFKSFYELFNYPQTISPRYKSFRFDTGTSCGPQYLNIARVRLTKPRRYWLSGCARGGRLFEAADEVRRALAAGSHTDPVNRPLENYAIYADGFIGGRCLEAGVANRVQDPSPGWYNRANRGGYAAMVNGGGADNKSKGSDDFADGEPVWFRRDTLVHEIMHTFGAVLNQAPHSTGLGHCTDGPDLMCYDDGGPHSAQTFPCGSSTYLAPQLDCDFNDYFKPAGRLTDWRGRRMWNTYDSAFLCYTGTCTSNVKPPAARLSVARSSVNPGERIRLDATGSRAGAASIRRYQWFSKRDGHGPHELKRLRNRRSPTIRLDTAGVHVLTVRVTDLNGAYSTAHVHVRVS